MMLIDLFMADEEAPKNESIFSKINDWFKNHSWKPYVKVRDLNNGEIKPHSATEIGIKISF